MALLGVALDIMRRYRAGVVMLVVFGALLTAPVAAHASGTVTVDGAGAVTWLGAQNDLDTIVLTNSGGTFSFTQPAGSTITLVNTSGGVVTASNIDTHTVQVGPGTGAVTSIVFDDLGVSNRISIERVATTIPIAVRNTSGAAGQDVVSLDYNNNVHQFWAFMNGSVTLDEQVTVTVDYASTTRAQLVLDSGDDQNDVLVAYSGNAGGLASLELKLGMAADQVVVQSTAAVAPVTIRGVGNTDTVRIGDAGSLMGINGVVNVGNLFGKVSLDVDGHADLGKHTVGITSTQVTGLAPAAINFTASEISALTITANGAGNTFNILSAITGDTIVDTGAGDDLFVMPQILASNAKVTLKGGDGTNTLDYSGRSNDVNANLQAGTASDVISLTGVRRVIGGTGNDTFTVNGVATVLGGGGTDTLVVIGSSQADTCEVFAVASDAFVSCTAPVAFGVTATSIETITLNTGDENDTVTIKSTLSGQAVSVNGGNGNDTVILGNAGSTKSILGTVTVNGNSGTNAVTVDDQLSSSADVVTVSNGTVGAGATDSLFGTGGRLTYSNLATLLVQSGTGADAFTVSPAPVQGPAITLNAGAPSSTPGDVVDVITTGLSGTVFSINPPNGMFFANDRQAVTFQAFETVLADGVGLSGRIAFSQPNYTVNESGETATVQLVRTGFNMGPASVTLTPSDGTATSPSDYVNTPIVVSFGDGEGSATALVPIKNDTQYEGSEAVNLTVSNPTNGAALGTQSAATLTIQDNDAAPRLSIGSVTLSEGQSGTKMFNFPVTLSVSSSQTVTVQYTTADGSAKDADNDYVAQSGVLTFNPGVTSLSVSVVVNGDQRTEADEAFNVVLSNPQNATLNGSAAAGTIRNDDSVCGPRPAVQTTSVPGNGMLTTTITAPPFNNGLTNLITSIQFDRLVNARVVYEGRTITQPTEIPLLPAKDHLTFTVQRVQPNQPTTVSLTVVDGCSTWTTFVGGGVKAGF
jgi:hypothetical protein